MKALNKRKCEVLSPVGNREGFFAAINAGADAVYLGVKEFNARNNIENFTLSQLKEIVEYAHLFEVKVYLAINILIKDSELSHALEIVESAYNMGVDAIIVQDLGFASLLKKEIPEIELHASTQMGIHNLEGAKFIEKMGFSRVVLSRETPIEEIKRIKDGTNLEIEYFVQGALCVAFSGNCYLSSLLAGKSGNRGECKQFCRLPYKIAGLEKEGYYLSAKDFCMLSCLKDLVEAGVTSLKIEGRARRPSYTMISTSIYKKAVMNNFVFDERDLEDLKKVFNRGDFTKGYFEDKKIIDPKIQGHKGVLIGSVKDFAKGKRFNLITIDSKHRISKGDGLKFVKDGIEKASLGVGDVKEMKKGVYQISTTATTSVGCEVYLTLDSEFEKEALKIAKKIKINSIFNAKLNQKAELILIYKNQSVKICSEEILKEATSHPIDFTEVYSQLSKMGDEPFVLGELNVNLEEVFAPKSLLNQMRRDAIKLLKQKIVEKYKKQARVSFYLDKKNKQKNNNKIIFKSSILRDFDKIDSFKDCFVVYSPSEFVEEDLIKFDVLCKKNNMSGFIDLPVFATRQDIEFFRTVLEKTDVGVVANNYYALDLVPEERLLIGMGLNVYNSLTAREYSSVQGIVLSKELDADEMEEISCNVETFGLCKGKEEYMTLRHCPFKEFFGSKCSECKFKNGLIYTMQNGKQLLLERKKIKTCQFVLKSVENKTRDVRVNKYIEI